MKNGKLIKLLKQHSGHQILLIPLHICSIINNKTIVQLNSNIEVSYLKEWSIRNQRPVVGRCPL